MTVFHNTHKNRNSQYGIVTQNFYFIKPQASCLEAPSKIQAKASQCIWNKTDLSCSMTPAPNDPVFTVIVALLSAIMSIPVLIMLKTTLDRYGCNWPGSRGFEDDLINVKKVGERGDLGKNKRIDVRQISVAEKLRNSTRESAFGEEIKKRLLSGSAIDVASDPNISQIVYTGM